MLRWFSTCRQLVCRFQPHTWRHEWHSNEATPQSKVESGQQRFYDILWIKHLVPARNSCATRHTCRKLSNTLFGIGNCGLFRSFSLVWKQLEIVILRPCPANFQLSELSNQFLLELDTLTSTWPLDLCFRSQAMPSSVPMACPSVPVCSSPEQHASDILNLNQTQTYQNHFRGNESREGICWICMPKKEPPSWSRVCAQISVHRGPHGCSSFP